jgi:hypothetical protein
MGEFGKKNNQEQPKPNQVKVSDGDKEGTFTLELPDDGDYKLDVYDSCGKKGLQHISSYLICRDSDYKEPFEVSMCGGYVNAKVYSNIVFH